MKVRPGIELRPDMYNAAEACVYLGIQRATLGRLVKRRTLAFRKVGRLLKFLKADLDAYIERDADDGKRRPRAPRTRQRATASPASTPRMGDTKGVDDYLGIPAMMGR